MDERSLYSDDFWYWELEYEKWCREELKRLRTGPYDHEVNDDFAQTDEPGKA